MIAGGGLTQKRSRKRVTVKLPECPVKTLFIQWLGEWQEDAKQKDSKVQFVYGKAKRAMAKYPLPLSNGEGANVIQCCGPKICGMLEEKLQEHIREFGDPRPSTSLLHGSDMNACNNYASQPSTSAAPGSARNKKSIKTIDGKAKPGGDEKSSVAPKRKSPYIPAYRSGPNALLIALYNHHMNPNAVKPGLRKEELIALAQPLCDASFTQPPAGSEYYTAWSSMAHLVKKDLVHRGSSPPQFKLTPEGVDLAILLASAQGPGPPGSPVKSTSTAKRPRTPGSTGKAASAQTLKDLSVNGFSLVSPTATVVSSHIPSVADAQNDEQLNFVYTDSSGLSHVSKSQAHVEISPQISDDIGFMVRTREVCLQKLSALDYMLAPGAKDRPGYVSIFLCDRLCPEQAPGLDEGELSHISSKTAPPPTIPTLSSQPPIAFEIPSTSNSVSTSQCFLPPMRQHSSSTASEKNIPGGASTSKDASFCLPPGSFDVVLCVDLGETAGAHPAKKQLETTLRRNNVPFEQRRLKVGDFIWIARRRSAAGPSINARSDPQSELVLDFVVERKRLDDLNSSIIDGRFKEQKHRLQTCGIRRAVYLIEDYKSAGLTVEEDRALSAAVNTQIQSCFTVINTKDCEDTVAYLTLMTKHLFKVTKNKSLYRASAGEERSGEFDAKAPEWTLLSYADFQQAGLKQGATTVRHLFTQQLMQFRGMSADRALALTKVYPTPRSLVLALESNSSEKERLKMVASVKPDGAVTSIGPALAKLADKCLSAHERMEFFFRTSCCDVSDWLPS